MNFDVDVFVIIKPGSFHVLVVQRETKRLNEMELAAGFSAKPNYVASVGGNFGLNENDVKQDKKCLINRNLRCPEPA